ncbi:hypothetical protein [Ruegeria arenilitoris]|uniref:hypothetical protein n=1 Tax=Ruegeria arenilitoris TaxID=1173585 RepID=UPI00147C3EF0|nr:hypothetical protein [Ruegeria arenilitoris]
MSYEEVKTLLEATLAAIRDERGKIESATRQFQAAREELDRNVDVLSTLSGSAQERIRTIVKDLQELSGEITNADNLSEAIGDQINGWIGDFSAQVGNLKASLVPDLTADEEEILSEIGDFAGKMEGHREGLEEHVTEELRATLDGIQENLVAAANTLDENYQTFVQGVEQNLQTACDRLTALVSSKSEAAREDEKTLTSQAEEAQEAMRAALQKVIEETTTRFSGMHDQTTGLIEELNTTVSNFNQVLTLAQQAMDLSGAGMRGATTSLEVVTETLNSVV